MKNLNTQARIGILLTLMVLLSYSASSQKGIPFITNYELPVSMSAQNYQVIQGDNNMMYVLNQNGVFSFDGYVWERMPVSAQPIALTYIDNLFVGGDQSLGYFKKNLKGINVYTQVDDASKEFFYLFHHFNNTLYAAGVNGIYKIRRVDPYKVEPYFTEKDSSQIVTDMFNVGDMFFAVKNKLSIYKISKQDETLIVKSIGLNEEILFSFKQGNYQIIGTSANRIYRFDGNTLTPISIRDQNYLNASFLTSGISLNSKTIALSTLIGGCIVVDIDSGETNQIINYTTGLPDDEVTSMAKDNLGGLWLIQGMGISRVDLSVPISSYHHIGGLRGNILSIAKQANSLYVGTSDGLYKLSESKVFSSPIADIPKPIERKTPLVQSPKKEIETTGQAESQIKKKGLFSRLFGRDRVDASTELVKDEPAFFDSKEPIADVQKKISRSKISRLISVDFAYEKISGISGKVNQLQVWNGNLLVASSTGLYSVYLNQQKPIVNNTYVFFISPSIYDKNTIYAGSIESLYSIVNSNGLWVAKELIKLNNEKITSVLELSRNSLIVSTGYKVYRVDNVDSSSPTVKNITVSNATIVSPIVRKTNSDIVVITPSQIFKYYEQADSIGVYSEYPNQGNYKAFYSSSDRTWLRAGQQWVNYPQSVSNARIAKYLGLLDRVNYVSYTDSNEVWVVNGYSQIYKLSPFALRDSLANVDLYIKQVVDKHGNSLNTNYVKLESDNNALKIKLGAPFYLKERAVEYQYKLVGVMSEWSDWGNTPDKDFPFFPPGNHTLQFRARDAMGNVSVVHEYHFSIKPPFYQTIWFYLLVIAILIAAIAFFIRVRERNLIKEKEILEQKVKERTKTIEEQKNSIEKQRDELKIMNQEILQQKEEIEAQRDEITSQRDQIVSQNQDIIKSISYARRIQTAVMPSKELANTILKDYFILLKPRDIVSGDFFWMTQKNGKIIVAAADCTGHGVPGAFMSLMGITLLTEIVKNTDDIRPHVILNQLRTNIKRALSQVGKEHEAKDGMDIALSVIDINENKLMFAGAYNPLYLIRNSQLIEYKGDKMPVGVHINEKETFTLHEIPIQKNDCVYMFSDGYVDQFGGNNNRKFMAKNFKELLVTISVKEMQEQKTVLDDTIDQWIGPHDQLDDILVIGIRL